MKSAVPKSTLEETPSEIVTLFLFFLPRSEDCLSLFTSTDEKPISAAQGFIRLDDLSIVFVIRAKLYHACMIGQREGHFPSMTKCKSCCKVHKI